MRVNFEFEIHLPNIPQRTREIVCAVRGHKYKPFVKEEDYWGLSLFQYFYSEQEIDEECDRCGKYTYKPRKKKKSQTVSWARSQPLGKAQPTATEINLKKKK